MSPADLEDAFFTPWQNKWHQMNQGRTEEFRDINNPKIPVRYVQEKGDLIYRVRHLAPKVRKPRGAQKKVEEGEIT